MPLHIINTLEMIDAVGVFFKNTCNLKCMNNVLVLRKMYTGIHIKEIFIPV